MLKAAVTGASGHLGNCLVRELIKKGVHVKVLVHKTKDDWAKLGVDVFYGDILKPETLKKICEDIEVVFHCAALISIDNRHRKLVYVGRAQHC